MPDPQQAASWLLGDPDPLVSSPLMPAGGQAMAQALGGAASNIASLPKQAFEASEGLRQTGQYDPAPVTQTAMMLMGGGAPFAESGAAGIFGGRLAKGADQQNLLRAKLMESAGHDPVNTLRKTGWFRGADDQWRFEIPDQGAKWLEPPNTNTNLWNVLHHPELYDQYPVLGRYGVKFDQNIGPGGARFTPDEKTITFSAHPSPEDLQAALHETQHAVQNIEGFQSGSNPSAYMPLMEALLRQKIKTGEVSISDLDPMQLHQVNVNLYNRHAGEVEARNVEARRALTPRARRNISPWETEDIPRSQQIVR